MMFSFSRQCRGEYLTPVTRRRLLRAIDSKASRYAATLPDDWGKSMDMKVFGCGSRRREEADASSKSQLSPPPHVGRLPFSKQHPVISGWLNAARAVTFRLRTLRACLRNSSRRGKEADYFLA